MAKSTKKSEETQGGRKTAGKTGKSTSAGQRSGGKSSSTKTEKAKSAAAGGTGKTAAKNAKKGAAAKAGGAKRTKQSEARDATRAEQRGRKAGEVARRSAREELVGALNALIEKLDEQMLGILKQQAEILTHSQKRTEVIRRVSEFQTAIAKGQMPDEGVDPNAAWVEQTEGGFFMICVGRNRIFFNRDELRELTRICWKASDTAQGASRMYRWFERERGDFLNDTGIGRPNSAALRNLYEYIISHYKVKETT